MISSKKQQEKNLFLFHSPDALYSSRTRHKSAFNEKKVKTFSIIFIFLPHLPLSFRSFDPFHERYLAVFI